MNLPSKIFFFILLIAMGLAAALSYFRYVVRHDYRVEGEPAAEEATLPATDLSVEEAAVFFES